MSDETELMWLDKTFDDLSNRNIFDMYKLRATVFNGEQQTTYPDPDNEDLIAHHVLAYQVSADGHQKKLVAYARYFQTGSEVTLGRVVIPEDFRGKQLSKVLIRHILDGIKSTYPHRKIVIHSQFYIRNLYKEFGFVEVGDPFIEAERKHILMEHEPLQ